MEAVSSLAAAGQHPNIADRVDQAQLDTTALNSG